MSPQLTHRIIIFLGVFSLTGSAFSILSAQETLPPHQVDETPEASPETGPSTVSPENEAVLEKMAQVIAALDEDAMRTGNNWQLTVEETMMLVVTDANAGRMRIITPIAPAEELPEGAMERLLQANFDTALDARYAVAQGLVWSTFIHPLDTLTQRDFASGLLQTKTLSDTFGTTFSSGALNYGGGDSGAIIEDQLERLLEELQKREEV